MQQVDLPRLRMTSGESLSKLNKLKSVGEVENDRLERITSLRGRSIFQVQVKRHISHVKPYI